MPNEVKAWSCSWGCKRNVLTSLRRMEKHEKICYRNPAMKACVTCTHFIRSSGSGEDYEDGGCECGISLVDGLKNQCGSWKGK